MEQTITLSVKFSAGSSSTTSNVSLRFPANKVAVKQVIFKGDNAEANQAKGIYQIRTNLISENENIICGVCDPCNYQCDYMLNCSCPTYSTYAFQLLSFDKAPLNATADSELFLVLTFMQV